MSYTLSPNQKRAQRVRTKLRAVNKTGLPRLSVYRSEKHIYVQVIDDSRGLTIASASTKDKDFSLKKSGNVEAAKAVGALIAKRLKETGVEQVQFDRGGYLYHGRVKALADAARESGLVF
jgi:large subunit ribosomal protein L18